MAANYAVMGGVYVALKRTDDAKEAYKVAMTLASPDGFGARQDLGTLLLIVGDPEAALIEFNQVAATDIRELGQALVYYVEMDRGKSDALLNGLKGRFADVNAYGIAENYAYRGDTEQAFTWLERAARQHERAIRFTARDPLLVSLHSDPRFDRFLRKIN